MLMVVMIRRATLKLPFPLLLIGVFVALIFASTTNVSAITNNGLDASEFGNSTARYALEQSTDVSGANRVVIPVYYLNTAATATADSKPPANMTISINDFGGRTNTSMQVHNGSSWSGAHSSNFSFTISRSQFTYRADINGWEASYIARITNGGSGRVQYRANITSPTGSISGRGTIGKIGYAAANNNAFATANRSRCDAAGQAGCGQYYDYRIPFGTPCSASANAPAAAVIYDGDNDSTGTNYRVQGNRKFTVQIIKSNGENVPYSPSGSENNLGTATYSFTAQPKTKYFFIVNNVYANNVLQFKLPYDSIESLTDCNYNLNPSSTSSISVAEPAAGSLTATGYVTNDGTSISDSVNWQYTRCRIAPGANAAQYAKAADNTSNGVSTYNALGASCQQVGNGTRTFVRGLSTAASDTQPMPDIAPGSRICYVMSVNPPSNTAAANVWRHSTPSCTIIGKKPKVHVTGGDLWVGRQFSGVTGAIPTSGIQASLTIKDRTYGSWAEYGVLATGTVVKFGSGSAYAGGVTDFDDCKASPLTFANTRTVGACTASSVLGGYKSNQTIPNTAGAFATNAATPTLSGSQSLTNLNGLYKASGNLTITSSTIANGRSVIINAPGATVTIDGNISYSTSPLTSIDQIPQVVIIAGTINIRGASAGTAVSNVDAWLIASSTVNTCYDAGTMATLTLNVCGTPLTINGPVMTANLLLWRTAGSGAAAASADPAETINLRPDAYLWGIYQGSKSGRLETTYERELPPRF